MQAFVIMPFDQKLNRLYSMIIQDALERKGYTCIRQDMVNSGGHIMSRVIKNLAESDLVIAVLTDFNWNVAYELGIRHVMRRSGTLLMCDQNQQKDLKFDITGFDILYYDPNWMDNYSEESIISEIINRIELLEKNNSVESDSPVHDVYSTFPKSLLNISQDDMEKERTEYINNLKTENEELRKKNDELIDRFNALGIETTNNTNNKNIRDSIQIAVKNRIYYSDEAVDKLRELQNSNKADEFAEFLCDVIEHGFLDENDCTTVYLLCQRLDIPPLTKLFLEQAIEWYPDHEELNIYFANELAIYNNTREQAFIIANEMLGIVKKNGHFELVKHVSEKVIRAFFNVYLKLKKHKEILSLSPLLLSEYSKKSIQALIYRNVAVAYLHLDNIPDAKTNCEQALNISSQDDLSHHILFRIYRQAEDYTNAYLEAERCISCDSNDEDYYFIIAGFICDELYARTNLSSPPIAIDASDARRYAVPFILYALKIHPECARRALDFLKRNAFQEDFEHCFVALKTKLDLLEEFDDFDFSFVEYCFTQKEQ